MSRRVDIFAGAFEGRRVLVTGHTGFKGSWLCEWLLGLGAQVSGYALDPPTEPSLFVELGLAARLGHRIADVRDRSALLDACSDARPELVVHLAAQPLVRDSYLDPAYTYETNVMGTVNLLEAVRATDSVRAVLNVTSDKCYENRETGRAYAEGDPLGGHDPYSSSKACSELVTAAYRDSFFGAGSPVRLASARAGNVIGGGDWARDRILPDCVRALQSNETIEVRNPRSVRPWQHVLDPVYGYLLLAARMLDEDGGCDGAWNFGPDEDRRLTVGQIADRVVEAWGSGSWEEAPGRRSAPREARTLTIDATKAREQLGWRGVYGAEQAVDATVDWYRARAQGAAVGDVTRSDLERYAAAAAANDS